MPLEPGTRLGPYEVLDHLGGGGQADVYRARHVRLGREVAIKILPEELARDDDALARFEREARTASNLNHPHLVTIYDIGEAIVEGRTLRYIAMELIRGTTLRTRIHRDGVDALLATLADVADALAAAHENGVIHRDLKPDNVMVSSEGFVKVVDFGLAKHVAAEGTGAHVTADGFVVGTVGYMAPEQVRGQRDLDARVDIFALGCMLYEAVAKRPAFDGESAVDVMHDILHAEPPALSSPALDRIVRRCLAKDRERRFASMREVARAIRGMDEATAVKPGPVTRRRRLRARFVGVPLVVLLAVGGYFGYRQLRPPIHSLAVVPFVNVTGTSNLDLVCDGLADGVARELSRSAGLRVIATSSTERYRGGADRVQVARELHVDAVLVGQLVANQSFWSGRKLTLIVALVNGRNNRTIWTEGFPVAWPEASDVEYEIADAVCWQANAASPSVSLRQTEKQTAYEAYQAGQNALRLHTASAMKDAIKYFHQAIDIDAGYARAYAGLSAAHGRQAVLGVVPTPEAVEQELAEARKAVALDDSLPEAHYQLGMIARTQGDQAEYERQIARTLELDPNFALAHLERAKHLLFQRKFADAETAFQRARSLDPMSPGLLSSYAIHLLLMRQYEHSRVVLFNLTEQFPDYPNAVAYLAFAYSYLGRHADALAAIERAPQDNPNVLVWKGILLARAGRRDEAMQIEKKSEDIARSRFLPNYYRAQLRTALGEHESALSMLERGKAAGEWQLSWLPYDPGFDPLRSDPRFAALTR